MVDEHKLEVLKSCAGEVDRAEAAWKWLTSADHPNDLAGYTPPTPPPVRRLVLMFDVRCIERTVSDPRSCPGYVPHVVTRFSREEAQRTADQWRNHACRECIEVREIQHWVPA